MGAQMKLKQMTRDAIIWSFDDNLPDITFVPATASAENEEYAMLMGFQASMRDKAAMERKSAPGGVVTEAMRHAAVLARATFLAAGGTEWEQRGGSRPAPQNPVIAGIAAKRGCTYAEAEAFLAAQFLGDMTAA